MLFAVVQGRGRFTHRYCMRWGLKPSKGKAAHSCVVSFTAEEALKTLYDSRDIHREVNSAGGRAVTLGAVGVIDDVEDVLHAMRDWAGPKVRMEVW